MKRRDREPPAPTALDELMSSASLESSPWVKSRIRKLNLKGRLVHGWTPPYVRMSLLIANHKRESA